MLQLAQQFGVNLSDSLTERALNQAMRELFLAQSSDWAFIMKSGTVVEYAHKRTLGHLRNFLRLDQELSRGAIDEQFLRELELTNNVLPYADYRVFLRQFGDDSRHDLMLREPLPVT